MKELHEACNSKEASWAAQGSHGREGKERVSFGTNMSTNEELSDGGSVEKMLKAPLSDIECFHAQKFKGDTTGGKRVVLKISGGGNPKKQKTPVNRPSGKY
jgi:hypothetical protein